jgi:hypothetical protein
MTEPIIIHGMSKDPGPEGPALAHPGGVMKVATFTSGVPRFRFATDGIFDRFQVSGVSN